LTTLDAVCVPLWSVVFRGCPVGDAVDDREDDIGGSVDDVDDGNIPVSNMEVIGIIQLQFELTTKLTILRKKKSHI
jgi:hypothetical protein